jgi:hypothetical protein
MSVATAMILAELQNFKTSRDWPKGEQARINPHSGGVVGPVFVTDVL